VFVKEINEPPTQLEDLAVSEYISYLATGHYALLVVMYGVFMSSVKTIGSVLSLARTKTRGEGAVDDSTSLPQTMV